MSANCDVMVTFPIYGQSAAIRKPDSGRIVCKSYIFINSRARSFQGAQLSGRSLVAQQLLVAFGSFQWLLVAQWVQLSSFLGAQLSTYSLVGVARSSVVSDLRSETKGSRLESGCYLCAEVSSLQQLPCQYLSVCETGRSGSEELKKCPPHSPADL